MLWPTPRPPYPMSPQTWSTNTEKWSALSSHQGLGKLATKCRGQQLTSRATPPGTDFSETRWDSLTWVGEGSYTFSMGDERPLLFFFFPPEALHTCRCSSVHTWGQQGAKGDCFILLKGLLPFRSVVLNLPNVV